MHKARFPEAKQAPFDTARLDALLEEVVQRRLDPASAATILLERGVDAKQ